MKLLHTSDLHGSTELIREIKKVIKTEKIKYIVISGDITPPIRNLWSQKMSSLMTTMLLKVRGVKTTRRLSQRILHKYITYLRKLDEIGMPILLIPGNDDHGIFEIAMEQGKFKNLNDISYKTVDIGMGYKITAYPECNKQFFGMQTTFREKDEHEIMSDLLTLIPDVNRKKHIFMAHPPPYKFLDRAFKKNRGSKAIKVALEYFRPLMFLCGQIHENPGVEKLKDTIIVNGAVSITIIELNDKGVKEIRQLFSTSKRRKDNLQTVEFQ